MTKNTDDRLENHLVFISTFGPEGDTRLSKRINARVGIAGHVYATGVGYMTEDVVDDPYFYPTYDTEAFRTTSVLCVPIRIEAAVCGVLELVNRAGPGGFREKDRRLLEIFADYASISIQNLLDAPRAYEVAKRDGLTAIHSAPFLSRPYGFNEPALRLQGTITASLGVSSIRSNATTGASIEQQKNELLRHADAALYQAKQLGKNRAIGASEVRAQSSTFRR